MHESLGTLAPNAGVVLSRLVRVRERITREGVRGFETGRVESVFRLKQVQLTADKSLHLLVPVTLQLFSLGGHGFRLKVGNQIDDHTFVVKPRAISRPVLNLHGHGE